MTGVAAALNFRTRSSAATWRSNALRPVASRYGVSIGGRRGCLDVELARGQRCDRRGSVVANSRRLIAAGNLTLDATGTG